MFISCINGDAVNVDYVVHLGIYPHGDKCSVDAHMTNEKTYVLVVDDDHKVLQEYLDDLVAKINIAKARE